MKIFFAYIIGLALYIMSLAVLSCNNNADDTRPKNDTINPSMPSTTPSNDTTSYPRMNDRVPDSAQ
ncbi:MAG TPA: hypothetical protein VHM26_14665 [Chitinophagaceae bacterium]|nr:hypothetical protein [Chitinophagaceae bacterium]